MKSKRLQISVLFILLPLTQAFLRAQEDQPAEENPVKDAIPKDREPTLRTLNPRYLLSVGDSIEITFRFTPEYNQTVTIQPDGYINLRELPDMHIAGKSTPELVKMLQKAYSHILHDPVITVELKDFEKPYFIAGGELQRPGKYDLRGQTTLVQAIQIAGGFKESSKHSQVLLFRRLSDEWTEVKDINVKEMLSEGDLREDPRLRPGDLIYVPKNRMSKITRFIPTASVGSYVPF
jgi:polysaccharide export outer membrane protein